MFKSRIFWAFGILAFVAVVQAIVSWSTLGVANNNVQRGRVANELLVGYVDLLASKQRLRILLGEAFIGRPVNEDEVMQIQQSMRAQLDGLHRLSQRANALYKDDWEMSAEMVDRQKSLQALEDGLVTLEQRVPQYLKPDSTDSALDWQSFNQTFDMSGGLDLRAILAQSLSRERLATARDRAAADASLKLLNRMAIGAAVLLSSIAVLLAIYFTKALSKPLRRIEVGAKALESGDLDYRIPDTGNDEFSDLARAVNRMASELSRLRGQEIARREELEQLVQQRTHEVQEGLHRLEKLDLRRRQMFADISHELKTPTTAIRGEAEITLRGRDKPVDDYKDALARIIDSSKHLGLVIEDMLTLARSDIDSLVLDRKPLRLDELLWDTLNVLTPQLDKKSLQLNLNIQTTAWILADFQRLRQLFGIVMDNAIQYTPAGGRITVTLQEHSDSEGVRHAKLTFADTGIGIAKEDIHRVWQRHFRSENAKALRPDGNGLGLALAGALARAHFGQIELYSELGVGTQVVILLPVFETKVEVES